MSTKVVTGKVRFSYANVFEAKAIAEGQEPKFSVSLLIPKSDKKTLKKIKDAVEAELEELKSKNGGKLTGKIHKPLRDGDEERPDDEAYEDHYFMNANGKLKPGVVDENLDPIMSQDEFYSGCYGRASVTLYGFNTSGNKGVACGLNNLQKLEDGDRLGGGSSAADDFGDDEDDIL